MVKELPKYRVITAAISGVGRNSVAAKNGCEFEISISINVQPLGMCTDSAFHWHDIIVFMVILYLLVNLIFLWDDIIYFIYWEVLNKYYKNYKTHKSHKIYKNYKSYHSNTPQSRLLYFYSFYSVLTLISFFSSVHSLQDQHVVVDILPLHTCHAAGLVPIDHP